MHISWCATPLFNISQTQFFNGARQVKLLPQLASSGWHIRVNQAADNPESLHQIVHGIGQLLLFAFILGQSPRSSFINILISTADKGPNRLNGMADFHIVHIISKGLYSGHGILNQGSINFGASLWCQNYPLLEFAYHVQSAMEQITQIISQIRVDTLNQSISGEIAILTQIDFSKQEIADSICTKFLNQANWIYYIANGFRHFGAIYDQPAVAKYLLWQRQIQGHQNTWPNNGMETNNFLAYQMNIGWPKLLEFLWIIQIANRG